MASEKKRKTNRIVRTVLIVLALLSMIILSSIPGSPLHKISSPISFLLDPIYNGFSNAWSSVADFRRRMVAAQEIQAENARLEEENAALRRQVNALVENGRRYEELKSAFQIKEDFADYVVIAGRILTEEQGTLFDVLKLDVGIRDGVNVTENTGFPVLDAQSNLAGRVWSTDYVSGKVLPLTAEGFAASARIVRSEGAIVRVRGDVLLKKAGLCRVDHIPAGSAIRVGDQLVTSGLGGIFPAGIPIGEILSVDEDASSLERSAILAPYIDFHSLDTLFVMMGKEVAP